MRQTGQFELLSGEVQVFARDLGEVVMCQPQVCRSNRIRSAAAAGVRSQEETTCIDARVHCILLRTDKQALLDQSAPNPKEGDISYCRERKRDREKLT